MRNIPCSFRYMLWQGRNHLSRALEVYFRFPTKLTHAAAKALCPGATWRGAAGLVQHKHIAKLERLQGEKHIEGTMPIRGWRSDVRGVMPCEDLEASTKVGPRLDLVELYTGLGNISLCVRQLKGKALRVGETHGHDLKTERVRSKINKVMKHRRPRHLWCSPKCKDFCLLNVNTNSGKSKAFAACNRRERKRQEWQLRWMSKVMEKQLMEGGDVTLEQPVGSKMLNLPFLQKLSKPSVCRKKCLQRVVLHQCRLGLRDPQNHLPMTKPTVILSSSSSMRIALDLACRCKGDHQIIEGSTKWRGRSVSRSSLAETYPLKMARAIADVVMQ